MTLFIVHTYTNWEHEKNITLISGITFTDVSMGNLER